MPGPIDVGLCRVLTKYSFPGALLGGWLLSPLFGVGTINQNDFSIGGLLVSLLGALILLFIVNLIRGRGRPTAP